MGSLSFSPVDRGGGRWWIWIVAEIWSDFGSRLIIFGFVWVLVDLVVFVDLVGFGFVIGF